MFHRRLGPTTRRPWPAGVGYQPGDTIWVKTWHLRSRDLSGEHGNQGLHYQLISPRGTVVVDHLVRESVGLATNDVAIPPGIEGGEYRLRVVTLDRHQAERPLMIGRSCR